MTIPSQRSRKDISARRGLLRLLGVTGLTLRPRGRRLRRAIIVAGLLVAALAGIVTPALSANGSLPVPEIEVSGVASTRVGVHVSIKSEGSATNWSLQLAGAPGGPWTTIETEGGPGQLTYNHLTPSTPYYLRVVATNASGTTTDTTINFRVGNEVTQADHFTTRPVAAPEIGSSVEQQGAPLGQHGFTGGCGSHLATQIECANGATLIETNGAATTYSFEWAEEEGGPYKPFTAGEVTGTVTTAEDLATPAATVTGLQPETTYFVRVTASNEKGTVVATQEETTGLARPIALAPEARDVTGTSAQLSAAGFHPDGFETEYRLEYTREPDNAASWGPVSGGTGSVPATEEQRSASVQLTGLAPGTVYYAWLFVKNSHGQDTSNAIGFKTAGPPEASTFAVHALHGEDMRALGSIAPNGAATNEQQIVTIGGGATGGTFTLTFDGETTKPLPLHDQEAVSHGLAELPAIGFQSDYLPNVSVSEDFLTNTYVVEFIGSFAGNPVSELTADASGLTPSGTVTVATQLAAAPFDASYHLEYEPVEAGVAPFSHALSTATLSLPAGESSGVGEDLPGLQAGARYRYRFVASNNSPGNPVVDGQEQTLTVPAPIASEQPACPNQALRSGFSANLPDCRAFEQVTPADKGPTQDIFKYGKLKAEGAAASQDGERVLFAGAGVQWGDSPDPAVSTYLFTRNAQSGWQMTPARPASTPELLSYENASILGPDLTQIGFGDVHWVTGVAHASPDDEVRVGPVGGPYVTIAKIPAKDLASGNEGLVAAAPDSSAYVVETTDHTVLGGSATGTTGGPDLYEYSAGRLRQLNVDSAGHTIGRCGARMVDGSAESRGGGSSLHAVSLGGRRAFFEAVPGSDCSEPADLYMRQDGSSEHPETVDLGQVTFLAANAQGSRLLLEKPSGEARELLLYDSETGASKTIATVDGQVSARASEELAVVYIESQQRLTADAPAIPRPVAHGTTQALAQNLYRYDVASEGPLRFLFQVVEGGLPSVSPDGRYLYLTAFVEGFPASPASEENAGVQELRYDSVENLIQCITCASPFDPEPKFGPAVGGTDSHAAALSVQNETESGHTAFSADGRFAIFMTTAALVPADVDGEVPPEEGGSHGIEHEGSPSYDIYEWRANGVDGCSRVQGCIALITTGRGGFQHTDPIGMSADGRDLFFDTHEALAPSDVDTAGDIYDARIDGGFPAPAPPPVECEGDSCSTPFAAPSDLTPSSSTFQGAGNVPSATAPVAKAHPKKKPKKKVKPKKRAAKKGKNRSRGAKR